MNLGGLKCWWGWIPSPVEAPSYCYFYFCWSSHPGANAMSESSPCSLGLFWKVHLVAFLISKGHPVSGPWSASQPVSQTNPSQLNWGAPRGLWLPVKESSSNCKVPGKYETKHLGLSEGNMNRVFGMGVTAQKNHTRALYFCLYSLLLCLYSGHSIGSILHVSVTNNDSIRRLPTFVIVMNNPASKNIWSIESSLSPILLLSG